MKRLSLTVSVLLSLICICCSPIEEPEDGYSFAIYFLEVDSLKIDDIYECELDSLCLNDVPWITNNDIEFYDWSSHCIYLKKSKSKYIPGWSDLKIVNSFPDDWTNKPFVVTANDKKCYLGYFNNMIQSYYNFPLPCFSDIGFNSSYPSDILILEWNWLFESSPLDNILIKNSLENSGLIKYGIQVEFDLQDTNVFKIINNSDTSTISYKFSITNNDEDNLYFLDPDKVDNNIFHYYNNGPVLFNNETNSTFYSVYKENYSPPYLNYWSPDWFTKIESMESIERTVILKGYPYIPDGRYIFEYSFSSPIIIKKRYRELSDGRCWLGRTKSNTVGVCIESMK